VTWRELGYALLFSLALAWVDAAVGLLVLCVFYVSAFPLLTVLVPEYQPDVLFGFIPADYPGAFLATALGIALLPFALYLVTAYASGRATLTRFFLLDRDAVGRRMGVGGMNTEPDMAIVGVVADAKYAEVKADVPPMYFTPWRQNENTGTLTWYMHSAGEASPHSCSGRARANRRPYISGRSDMSRRPGASKQK
jgi:hypothetical protein